MVYLYDLVNKRFVICLGCGADELRMMFRFVEHDIGAWVVGPRSNQKRLERAFQALFLLKKEIMILKTKWLTVFLFFKILIINGLFASY
jgi:hypothetical protein